MAREIHITLRLSGAEVAKLDEFRLGLSRSAYLRQLLHDADADRARGIASHDEALSILSAQARDGKVAAAIALERATRNTQDVGAGVPEWMRDDD